MLFDVFSWVFRSDVVLPQAKKREVVMSSRGGLNVVISLVLAMFRKRHVFRRCVLNEFRSRFQWKIVCSGGAQELKTIEILVFAYKKKRNPLKKQTNYALKSGEKLFNNFLAKKSYSLTGPPTKPLKYLYICWYISTTILKFARDLRTSSWNSQLIYEQVLEVRRWFTNKFLKFACDLRASSWNLHVIYEQVLENHRWFTSKFLNFACDLRKYSGC